MSSIVFCAFGICWIAKFWKYSLHRENSSMCVVKAGNSIGVGTIFTNCEQSIANITYEICKVFMHCIAQNKASHYACKCDRLLRIFMAPIIVSLVIPFLQKPTLSCKDIMSFLGSICKAPIDIFETQYVKMCM